MLIRNEVLDTAIVHVRNAFRAFDVIALSRSGIATTSLDTDGKTFAVLLTYHCVQDRCEIEKHAMSHTIDFGNYKNAKANFDHESHRHTIHTI